MKVKFITLAGSAFEADVNKQVKLTEHFKLYELANNAGDPKLAQYELSPRSQQFLHLLEIFRLTYNAPIVPNSCYRQSAYNAKLPGADYRSAHLHACAIDFNTTRLQACEDIWRQITGDYGLSAAINRYTGGVHLELFTKDWYTGTKERFTVRDCRGTKNDW